MNKEIFRFIIAISLGILISFFFKEMVDFYKINSDSKFEHVFINDYLIPLAVGLMLSVFIFMFLRTRNKDSHSFKYVTIIGEPNSGKTTLITSFLKALFETRLNTYGTRLYVKGKKTISYYNENINLLDKGRPVIKTETENTTTVFIDSEKPSILGPKYGKILIGDFPGEKSDYLVNEKEEFLNRERDFSTWIEQADVYIYVIDVARYLIEGRDYIANSKSYIRTSWQTILELNSHKRYAMRSKPLILVFNKSDLIIRQMKDPKLGIQSIVSMGFSDEELPETISFDRISEYEYFSKLLNDYDDLLSYLKGQSDKFDKVLLSSFLKVDDKYLGIQELYNSTIRKI